MSRLVMTSNMLAGGSSHHQSSKNNLITLDLKSEEDTDSDECNENFNRYQYLFNQIDKFNAFARDYLTAPKQ